MADNVESFLRRELSLRGLYITQYDKSNIVKPRGTVANVSVQEGESPEPGQISITRSFFDEDTENIFLSLCAHGYENLPGEISTPTSQENWDGIVYMSKVKHTWYLTKFFETSSDEDFKLTVDAIECIQKLTTNLIFADQATPDSDVKDDIVDLFNKFGSHVSTGPFVLGGRCVEKVTTSDIRDLNKAVVWSKLEEEFASMGPEEANTSFAHGDPHIVLIKTGAETEEAVEFNRHVQFFGGSKKQTELQEWKDDLSTSSLLVSGAVSLVNTIPIWDILLKQGELFSKSRDALYHSIKNVWLETNSSGNTKPNQYERQISEESDGGSENYETASDEDTPVANADCDIKKTSSKSSQHDDKARGSIQCYSIPELLVKLNLCGETHSLGDATVLREDVLGKADYNQNAMWSFVRCISSLDYRGRKCLKMSDEIPSNVSGNEGNPEVDIFDEDDVCGSVNGNKTSTISSMDVTHAVLHCCDAFLRQELMWKMTECRLAVPVLLPGIRDTQSVQFLLWGLRKVYKCWKPRDGAFPIEKSMTSHPLPIVAFLRFGNINISKSKLLNKILGKLQGNNDHSYFVDVEEEAPCAKWSKGTVEVAWFLPETAMDQRGGSALQDAVTFFNLRGDALKFSLQKDFACKAADVVVLLVQDTMYSECIAEMKKLSQTVAKHLLCIVCKPLNILTTEGENIKRRGKVTKIFSKSHLMDTGEDICRELNRMLWPSGEERVSSCDFRSIESLTSLCKELGIYIDEQSEDCLAGKKMATDIIRSVRESYKTYKETRLPLQEVLWKEWASLDKKWNKGYRAKPEHPTIEHYHDVMREKMLRVREKQFNTKPGRDIRQFVDALEQPSHSSQYFVAWLNFYLNDLCQEKLGPLRKELRDIQNRARQIDTEKSKLNDKPEKTEDEKEKVQLLVDEDVGLLGRAQEITTDIDRGSLGMEHFIREIGQRFEAFEEQKFQVGTDVDMLLNPNVLPQIAANLLINGYPLEILDGDVGRVPIRWVQAVFKVVVEKLENAKVCAIAVLGIQSSGKSTLLNSMFGVRFAVSAGRCTRGVFIQLLKVHEDLQKETQCEYVIIIDTEGLKAPERSFRDDFRHDNELATFALCLADLTIINIAGQTVGKDMTDVLQIAAHAFIRMKEVHIKSSCRIIQQFVADLTAEDKNEACTQCILNNLDEAIAAAAKDEGYGDLYNRFSDVFNLKRNEDVQYIPSLWQGSMAPPNHRYSEKILKLKAIIVSDLKLSSRSLGQFAERTSNVWNAVKEENFIFSFQNCVVALRYKNFQHAYGKWVGEMRQAIMEWESNAKHILKNASTDVDHTKKTLKGEIKPMVMKEGTKIEILILDYLKDNLGDDEDQLHKFEEEFLQDLELTQRNFEQDAREALERVADSIAQLNHMDVLLPKCKNQLREKARTQAVELRRHHSDAASLETVVTEKEIDAKFDDLWDLWIKEICDMYPMRQVTREDVDREFDAYLIPQGQKKDIAKGLKKKLGVTRNVISKAKDYLSTKVYGNQEETVKQIIVISLAILQIDIDNELAFDPAIIQKLVDSTIASLNTTSKGTPFTQETKVNAMVEVCTKAAPIILQGRRQYNVKYSLRELLTLERDNLREDFHALCSNAFQDKRASENLTNLFEEKLVEVIRSYLGPAIYRAVREGCPYFASKFAMFGHILEDIATKEVFNSYYKFIFELETFLEEWSLDKMAEICTKEASNAGKSFVENLACIKIEEMAKDLLRCIRLTVKTISKKRSANIDHMTFSTWITYLRTEVEKHLPILCLSDADVKNLLMFNVKDLKFFGDQVIGYIEKQMRQKVLRSLDLPSVGKTNNAVIMLRSLPTKPHREIKKHVSGCTEQCPICHVPCDNMTKQHDKHRAELHYPEGVVGCATARDNRLTCSICTSSVTTNDFYWDGQKKRQYCNYQRDFPQWVIQPIQNDTPLNYWKWVLNRFNEDFAQLYSRGEADIPYGWSEITKKQALDDLREAYVTRQDAS